MKLLLGADPGTLSRIPAWNSDLAQQFSSEFREFLFHQAASNLRAHDIDEPVLWQPPLTWLDNVDSPGVSPDAINTAKLIKLLVPGRSLSQVGETLNISEDHIRLHIESIEASTPMYSLSRSPAPGRNIPRQGFLSFDELQRHYLEQGLPSDKVARLAGCSGTTVRRALAEFNIAFRMHGLSKTRNCLKRLRNVLHISGHVSVSAAANSLGIAPTTLRRQLRGIEAALGAP